MGDETEPEISATVERIFRQDAGKIVSNLTGIFGLRNLQLVEDALQEALLKALKQWSYGNMPRHPLGWLMRVSRNHALDALRRDARLRQKEEEIIATLERDTRSGDDPEIPEEEIRDDQLRMIFACCHPAIPADSQIALTLKTLCGFGLAEIARAFLTPEQTIAKRLTRARQRLQKGDVAFAIPSGPELSDRLEVVLAVLYLLFNEGYNASQGANLIRHDLCNEAIRLVRLLHGHGATALPKTEALLALMLLQASRFPSRRGEGPILLLREQDRTRWNKEMIAEGMMHLERSARGAQASAFHLQGAIAACHCLATSYEATDWGKIVALYDLLLEVVESPVVALNRAVALAEVQGPEAALRAIGEIQQPDALQGYYLYHAVVADLCARLQRYSEAAAHYGQAIALTALPAEKTFLTRKLRALPSRESS